MGHLVRPFPCCYLLLLSSTARTAAQHAAESLSAHRQRAPFGSFCISAYDSSAMPGLVKLLIRNANNLNSLEYYTDMWSAIPPKVNAPMMFVVMCSAWFPWILLDPSTNVKWPDARVCHGHDHLHEHQRTVICTSLPLLSSFPCDYPPTKIPVFGVAFAALEKLHLGSNFVLRDRGLLNLERQRSEQFPTPSPTHSLSQGPSTGPSRECDNAKSAKLQLRCHCRHYNYSPCFRKFGSLPDCHMQHRFLGKRITTQAPSTASSITPTAQKPATAPTPPCFPTSTYRPPFQVRSSFATPPLH